MKAEQEITFELTADLRDQILEVQSDADAASLLGRLGVHVSGPLVWGLGRQFESLGWRIRQTESRYGSFPLDFSDDPLMGLGRFATPQERFGIANADGLGRFADGVGRFTGALEGKFWRNLDYCRPMVGIKVLLNRVYPSDCPNEQKRVEVLPMRAEPSEVVIPEGITKMDGMGFMGCSRIQKVTIPSSMHEIPDGAFWGCAGLRELVVPNGVTTIGPAAFANCENLRRVVLPASLEHIGCGAFVGCTSLEEVIAPEGLAVPRAAHVFDGCKLPADSYCCQTDQPVDKERALKDLDELLWDFGRMLDGPNSVHSLTFVDADAPDPDDIPKPANDTVEAIREMLENAFYPDFPDSDDFDKAAEEDMLLLSRLIVDTLDSACDGGAKTKAYYCTPAFRKECEKQCFALANAIMIRTGDEWCGLVLDWTD